MHEFSVEGVHQMFGGPILEFRNEIFLVQSPKINSNF